MPEPTDSIASSPWVNQTDQDFGGPSSTMGSNHLQDSLDRLTKAVEDLRSTMGASTGNDGFGANGSGGNGPSTHGSGGAGKGFGPMRSEEHTSELQSLRH